MVALQAAEALKGELSPDGIRDKKGEMMLENGKTMPSIDAWLREAKADSVRDALAALGATADDAVMIGDRFNDVEGAHAMGVPCIGIYSGAAAPGEHEAAGADAVVHSVAELAKLFAI